MLQPREFCKEIDAQSHHTNLLASFWDTRNKGHFIGRYGLRLQWCSFTKQEHTKAVIIVNGRTECMLKYKEVFYDLFSQGFDIYSYDHRGQGISQRLVVGSDVGHVVKFQHYVDDLEGFMNLIVSAKNHESRTILAHSMGGAIATLYAAEKPNTINKLILCAPMFDIYMPKWLSLIASPLSKFFAKIEHPADYSLGQTPYKSKTNEMERLTHSKVRFNIYRSLYDQNKSIQVGGPSACWIYQSLKVREKIHAAARTIELPILLLQGGKDRIVNNQAMFKFHHERQVANLPIQFEIQADGLHELLFEQDEVRDTILNLALDFIEAKD